jgi:hypothetical protein
MEELVKRRQRLETDLANLFDVLISFRSSLKVSGEAEDAEFAFLIHRGEWTLVISRERPD